ncbi:site-specific integrase [Pseudomonas protegens]|uniref:site-specific integrase n=1 Tax=Pseudomonas protegens TaxID=380021 RepID=UPI00064291F4|nr:site-specific integrase [Pseudomonas protegens]
MGEPVEAPASVGLDSLQHSGNEQFYSRDGYVVDLLNERWRLSKDIDLPIGELCKIFPGDSYTLRQVFAFYARHSSPSHVQNLMARLAHYVKTLKGAELFSVESFISYRASLDKPRAWYLSIVRVLVRQWTRLGYPGVPAQSLALLDNLRIKGNEKGRAVQSRCPEEGPLTDVEMQGIVESTTHCFATNILGLTETAMLMTFAMTGRRPAQVSALKLKDLISLGNKYFINFPRAKQRNMGWRSSFKKFAIIEDLWLLLNEQANYVRVLFAKSLNIKVISAYVDGELPLFPNMNEELTLARELEVLKSDRLHIPSLEISHTVVGAGEKINVISERSGQPLHLNPNRFRYTLGTNLAGEGKGVYVIAEALDHSDIQNAGVYVKNLPDIVERIDKAVAMQLAPYAQIFRGVVIPSEKQALRGNDPSSRISNGNGNLGNCGSHGFCGALAPVACYTCAHFQPWLDGPHEEVLDGLIQERERVKDLTGDLKVASANDRLIYAVSDVINRCRVAKGELK